MLMGCMLSLKLVFVNAVPGGVIAQLTCRSDLWMAIVWLIVSAIINANVSAGWGWWARPHHPNKQPEMLQ